MKLVNYYQNKGQFNEFEHCGTYEYEDKADVYILEDMWRRFNSDSREDGKIRRSMSIGDIVTVDERTYTPQNFDWLRLGGSNV
jgi:hypothetical protein